MWSYIGILLFIYIVFDFLNKIGKKLPIIEFLLIIAAFQWIFSPFLEYRGESVHFKYYMYVEEEVYFGFVVPCFALFSIILLRGSKLNPISIFDNFNINHYRPYATFFIVMGFLFGYLIPWAPTSLRFVLYILGSFKFIGLIILFFTTKGFKEILIYYSLIIFLFYESLTSGFFHDFILWSSFLFMYWAVRRRPKMSTKIILSLSGLFLVFVIQLVKFDLRNLLHSGKVVSIYTITNSLSNSLSNNLNFNASTIQENNTRFNQGWIISAVLDHVPANENYAKGETIVESLISALLPRFLYSNKKVAGGRENFIKYTGLDLGENTSMGISLIGELYANFGYWAFIGMSIWAYLLVYFLKFLNRLKGKFPFINFFMPLIFFQVVKAETELVVVLNHLVKLIIFLLFFLYFTSHILKWPIYDIYKKRLH